MDGLIRALYIWLKVNVIIVFSRIPPGPWSFPLLGVSVTTLNRDAPHLQYTDWNRKYGDIISFTMYGTTKAVVISSETILREAFYTRQDQFAG